MPSAKVPLYHLGFLRVTASFSVKETYFYGKTPPLPSTVPSDRTPCAGASAPDGHAAFNWLLDLKVCIEGEYEDDK